MSEHQPVEGTEALPDHKENVLAGYRDKKEKPQK